MDIIDKNAFVGLAKEIYELTLLFPKKESLRHKLREVVNDILADFVMKENNFADNLERRFILAESYLEIAKDQDWVAAARIGIAEEKIQKIKSEFFAAKTSARWEEKECARQFAESAPVSCASSSRGFVLIPTAAKTEIAVSPPQNLMMPQAKPLLADNAGMKAVPVAKNNRDEKKEENKADISRDVSAAETTLTAAQIERQNRILEVLKEKGKSQVWEIQNIFPRVSKRTIRRDFRAMLEQGLIERVGERNTTAYKLKVNLS